MSLDETLAEAKRQSDLLMERGMPMQAGMVDALATLWSDTRAEIKRLRAVLGRYSQAVEDVWPYVNHKVSCRRITSEFCEPEDCDCGLQAALNQGRVRDARQHVRGILSAPDAPAEAGSASERPDGQSP